MDKDQYIFDSKDTLKDCFEHLYCYNTVFQIVFCQNSSDCQNYTCLDWCILLVCSRTHENTNSNPKHHKCTNEEF